MDFSRVRASLPQLDGSVALAGLASVVTIERDALGVPTIRAGTRADAARALGWLHGQDRFFQIDILRRVAAGELSEVFGKRALVRDRAARMHGFRKLAHTVLAGFSAEQRAIVESYAAGVNAGLSALRAVPFEYLLLREQPRAWQPEDSLLVIYAMTIDLQDEEGDYERSLMTIRDQLGLEALAFFAPMVTPTDAALDGTTAPIAPIPGTAALNLREKKLSLNLNGTRGSARSETMAVRRDPFPFESRDPDAVMGSNAFALAGTHTASGAGMVANDMHLDHGVPNIWYRVSLEYGGRKVTGVTLPGTPAVVAGSNGTVAWGFTNSYVDSGDLVVVELNSIANSLYRAPGREDLIPLESRKEIIRVKGESDVAVDYTWTIWGPIVGTNDRGRPLAYRMVAHDPKATNFNLINMEAASSVNEAIDIAHHAGMPAQNILIADKSGEIAWTIAGQVPKRVGYDGRLPVTWTFGDRKWDGYLSAAEIPVVRGGDATSPGRLWSANNRHVGGDALAKLGDGAYRRAPRAAQIRDDLARLTSATPRDLLAVQLDDRALFLEPWHRLMMETLSPAVIAQKKSRASLRGFAEKWEGRASPDAVSYRLAREFRTAVHDRVFGPIFVTCVETYPRFDRRELQLEGAVWAILREKPLHLLAPEFHSWDELLVAAIDDVINVIDKSGVKLPQANWGRRNTARVRHPFSNSFPWLARWLNMPADPLPGDADMPRVQSPGHGASERLVVSPGHEAEGIFHMPGGQSAHPLSLSFVRDTMRGFGVKRRHFCREKRAHTLTLKP